MCGGWSMTPGRLGDRRLADHAVALGDRRDRAGRQYGSAWSVQPGERHNALKVLVTVSSALDPTSRRLDGHSKGQERNCTKIPEQEFLREVKQIARETITTRDLVREPVQC